MTIVLLPPRSRVSRPLKTYTSSPLPDQVSCYWNELAEVWFYYASTILFKWTFWLQWSVVLYVSNPPWLEVELNRWPGRTSWGSSIKSSVIHKRALMEGNTIQMTRHLKKPRAWLTTKVSRTAFTPQCNNVTSTSWHLAVEIFQELNFCRRNNPRYARWECVQLRCLSLFKHTSGAYDLKWFY